VKNRHSRERTLSSERYFDAAGFAGFFMIMFERFFANSAFSSGGFPAVEASFGAPSSTPLSQPATTELSNATETHVQNRFMNREPLGVKIRDGNGSISEFKTAKANHPANAHGKHVRDQPAVDGPPGLNFRKARGAPPGGPSHKAGSF